MPRQDLWKVVDDESEMADLSSVKGLSLPGPEMLGS